MRESLAAEIGWRGVRVGRSRRKSCVAVRRLRFSIRRSSDRARFAEEWVMLPRSRVSRSPLPVSSAAFAIGERREAPQPVHAIPRSLLCFDSGDHVVVPSTTPHLFCNADQIRNVVP